jgi:hypothetical protein
MAMSGYLLTKLRFNIVENFDVKQLLIALALVAAALPVLSSPASAAVCYARSPTGSWGYGYGAYSYARARALAECATRTPRGYWCQITSCR